MNARSDSIAPPISSLCTMSPVCADDSTRSWTSVSMRRDPVAPRIAISSTGRAEVVTEPDRLDEVLIEPQCAGDTARDPRRLERMREPCAEMVALGIDEDLRLVAQPAERFGMDDPVAVALERRSQPAFLLDMRA